MSTETRDPSPGDRTAGSADGARGLVGSVFDLSFQSMVTPKLIRMLFVLLCVLQMIPVLGGVITAFTAGPVVGVLALILAPVVYLIAVLFVRIYLELIIVVFRIYETLRDRPL